MYVQGKFVLDKTLHIQGKFDSFNLAPEKWAILYFIFQIRSKDMILMYMQGKFLLFYLASRKSAIMNFFSCTVNKQKRIVGPLNILINPDTYFI